MVGQVKIVAILMMVEGGLAIAMALVNFVRAILVFTGGLGTPALPPEMQGNQSTILAGVAGGVACVGFLALVGGALNLFGGFKALKYQSRTLVLVALFSNILPLFTCWCILTSLGVMIYGLIVIFNAQVAEAFKMGDQGTPPDVILAQFQPPPPPPA